MPLDLMVYGYFTDCQTTAHDVADDTSHLPKAQILLAKFLQPPPLTSQVNFAGLNVARDRLLALFARTIERRNNHRGFYNQGMRLHDDRHHGQTSLLVKLRPEFRG